MSDNQDKKVLNLKSNKQEGIDTADLSINARNFNRNVDNEGRQMFFDNINSFPIILTLQDVAILFRVTLSTIYHWSSIGLFDRCKFKSGKTVRIYRDKLLQEFFPESFNRKDSK